MRVAIRPVNAMLLAALLLTLGGCATVGSTASLLDTGYKFLVALRDGDDAGAFDMCCPALQAELVDATGLHARAAEMRPAKWQLQHWQMTQAGDQEAARLVGHATLADGLHADVTLELVRADGDWQVTGFRAE